MIAVANELLIAGGNTAVTQGMLWQVMALHEDLVI